MVININSFSVVKNFSLAVFSIDVQNRHFLQVDGSVLTVILSIAFFFSSALCICTSDPALLLTCYLF